MIVLINKILVNLKNQMLFDFLDTDLTNVIPYHKTYNQSLLTNR